MIILVLLNFLAFFIVALFYYVFFDIHKGGNEFAFTWGLVFLIGAFWSLVCGILTLGRESWRWGVAGLAGFGAVLIFFFIILLSLSGLI